MSVAGYHNQAISASLRLWLEQFSIFLPMVMISRGVWCLSNSDLSQWFIETFFYMHEFDVIHILTEPRFDHECGHILRSLWLTLHVENFRYLDQENH